MFCPKLCCDELLLRLLVNPKPPDEEAGVHLRWIVLELWGPGCHSKLGRQLFLKIVVWAKKDR